MKPIVCGHKMNCRKVLRARPGEMMPSTVRHTSCRTPVSACALLVATTWLAAQPQARGQDQAAGEELHWLVERGDIVGARALLEQGADPAMFLRSLRP